jgi:uncharacterized protein YbaP (TraB family)
LGLGESEKREFKFYSNNKTFYLNMEEKSDTPLENILSAKLWLAAPLLSTHNGIISYHKFGGLEHELVSHNFWKNHWREYRVLETIPEVFQILEETEAEDYDKNVDWLKKNIRLSITFLKSKEDHLFKIREEEWDRLIKTDSWQVSKYSNQQYIPKSAIKRNKLWAEKLLKDLKEDAGNYPALIVVGNGHLAGYNQGWSLLSFLKQASNSPLFRFSNTQGWVPVNN